MTRTAATGFVLAVLSIFATAAPATAGSPPATKGVIELFTSQGCSSCPAADRLLAQLSKRHDLIALSFNVDYWDYLGWKDTLARPSHTKRQYAYARSRGDGKVYTPQAVINGVRHVIGSHQKEIDKAVDATAVTLAGSTVSLTLRAIASNFMIELDGKPPGPEASTVYIAAVRPVVTVRIKRGENRGSKISYHNVVRNLMPVGMWSGGPKEIRLPRRTITESRDERCVVLVQNPGPGAIIAAGWIPE